MRREFSLVARKAFLRKFLVDVGVELFERFWYNTKTNPQNTRVARGREAACTADLNVKGTDPAFGPLDRFANSADSSRLDISQELQR